MERASEKMGKSLYTSIHRYIYRYRYNRIEKSKTGAREEYAYTLVWKG
jgi:hypothetical protein